ncbi:kelch-like protein diablo isoform X2 [Ischnura elegans]|uniref:kelch-like protein diablo isoform X2 n=1 Tax=Ischnura elegans TaxID=197161 RepID=UPI001ED8A3C3|nr:kelch-like protein diablo isoform X2 [Ischnura elegans]
MQSCSGKHSKSGVSSGRGERSDDRSGHMPSSREHQRDYKHRQHIPSLFSDSSGDSSGSEGAAADEYIFYEMRHSSKVLGGLEDLRSEGHFCDVSLSVDGQLYPAHKSVLSAFSPYFKAMFTSRMAESRQQVVTLQGLDGPTLAIIIDYAYSAVAHINSSNAQALLSAANLFGIHSLRSACCRYLTRHMDASNALGVLCFAETHSCARMAATARAFVHKNFRDVSEHEEFLTLSPTKLREILSSDHLVADSEEVVFCAAVRWLEHDPQERAKEFHKILEVVRLHLLSPYFLHDYLEMFQWNGIFPLEEEEVVEDEKSKEKAAAKEESEALEKPPAEGSSPPQAAVKQKESSENSKPSKEEASGACAAPTPQVPSSSGSSLPVIPSPPAQSLRKPGSSNGSKKGDGLHCFSCKGHKPKAASSASSIATSPPPMEGPIFNKECVQLLKDACLYHLLPDRRSELPHPERARLRACADTCQVVLAVGGEDDKVVLRTVECFSPSSGEWRALDCLPFAISKHGLVSSGSSNWAYLCGGEFPDGRPSAAAWRYDPFLANAWNEVSSMATPRSELGLAMLDGCVFAVGGWDGTFGLDSVERYDPWRNQWYPVAPMPYALTSPAVVSHHGLLYVTGGSIHQEGDGVDLVQRYDPRSDAWHTLRNMLIPRSGAVACAIGPYIYVMGGWHASTENTNKVERYDVRNNCWEYRAPMQEKRYRPGASVVEGDIYVLGGEGGWNMYLETIEKYSPHRDAWAPAGEMPTARSWLSCITLQISKNAENKSIPVDIGNTYFNGRILQPNDILS